MVPGLFLQPGDASAALRKETSTNPGYHFRHPGGDDGSNWSLAWCDIEFYGLGPMAWPGAIRAQPLV